MAFPVQLLGGTFFFIFFGLALGALGLYLLRSKRLDRDNAQIYCTTIIVAVFSMWLMYACVWMHQWHPIILPTRAKLPHSVVDAALAAAGVTEGAAAHH